MPDKIKKMFDLLITYLNNKNLIGSFFSSGIKKQIYKYLTNNKEINSFKVYKLYNNVIETVIENINFLTDISDELIRFILSNMDYEKRIDFGKKSSKFHLMVTESFLNELNHGSINYQDKKKLLNMLSINLDFKTNSNDLLYSSNEYQINPNLIRKLPGELIDPIFSIDNPQMLINFLKKWQISYYKALFILKVSGFTVEENKEIIKQAYNQSIEDIFMEIRIIQENIFNILDSDDIDIEALKEYEDISIDLMNSVVFSKLNEEIIKKVMGINNSNKNYGSFSTLILYHFLRNTISKSSAPETQVFIEPFNFPRESNYRAYFNKESIRLNSHFLNGKIEPIDLNVIFHEVAHLEQFTREKSGEVSYEMLLYAKDQLLTEKLNDYYALGDNGNYLFSNKEIDARCVAIVNTIELLNQVNPDLANEFLSIIEEKYRSDVQKFYSSERIYKREKTNLHLLFDETYNSEMIQRLFLRYPILLYEYDYNGKPHSIEHIIKEFEDSYEKLLETNKSDPKYLKIREICQFYFDYLSIWEVLTKEEQQKYQLLSQSRKFDEDINIQFRK